MRPYLYIAKTRMLSALVYRFDVLSSIAVQCLIVIATSFFWMAAYGSQSVALGVTRDQMLTYTLISGVLASVFSIGVENRVAQSVRQGTVALDMLKPVRVFGIYLAEDLGGAAVSFFQKAVPLLLVGSLCIVLPKPAGLGHFLLFLLCAALSYLINWLLSALFGLWSFHIINMGPILAMKGHLIRLLSGSVVPLWFFPGWMRTALGCLPFQYIYQLPLSVYIGILSPGETVWQMGVQAVWLLILAAVFLLLSKKSFQRVLVQGG